MLIYLRNTRSDFGMQMHNAIVECVLHFLNRAEHHAFTFHAFSHDRGVIQTQNHILRGHDNRGSIGWRQHVIGGHHQHAGFQLGFQAKRHVYGHLVTVKIGVERGTDQRMQLNCFAFYQNRLKSLNAQPVQSGRAVQHHRVFPDHFI